jgi:predicted alpha/beta superfamily hydrolase
VKKLIVFLFLFITAFAGAQYSVRLVVTDVATKKVDDIYVSGNFNSWNPNDANYKLKPLGGARKGVVIKDLPAGNYAFKFTRGSLDKVECAADGRDISDHVVDLHADISQDFIIAGWKDDYPEKPRRYTASPQVKIIDTAFNIPQLNRKRRIWVYLPKSYSSSSGNYPVLYMQDGQNLFNEQTALSDEWGVDECLDTLQQLSGKECIVIGVDNGGEKRMNEYNPYDHVQYGKGEGKQYADFLANTLKPYIDSKYRTKKGTDYTFVAGSSMGGLISLYAIMSYPKVFGGAGVFSPSFELAPSIYEDAEKFVTNKPLKFYFYAGGRESASMVSDMQRMADTLSKKSNYSMRRVVNPLGQHKESYWRQEFAWFYKWMLTN